MNVTAEQLAAWLEEEGHAGCAEELLLASPERRPRKARDAAECVQSDPGGYRDGLEQGLVEDLVMWAFDEEVGVGRDLTGTSR